MSEMPICHHIVMNGGQGCSCREADARQQLLVDALRLARKWLGPTCADLPITDTDPHCDHAECRVKEEVDKALKSVEGEAVK